MKPFKTLEQIKQQITLHEDYFCVRELEYADDPESEREVLKLALGGVMRFYNGHTDAVRRHMPDIARAYVERFGAHLTGGYMLTTDHQATTAKKLNAKLLERCYDPKSWANHENGKSLFLGDYDLEKAHDYYLGMFLQESLLGDDRLSNCSFAVGLDYLNNPQPIIDWLAFVAERIPLHSARLGFYAALPEQFFTYGHNQVPIAERFYGCDVENTLAAGLNSPPIGISSFNWITIIGDMFVQQLGGAQVLADKAAQLGLSTREIGSNFLIQAGPYPDLCDNQDLPMNPYYLAVNALLKPIRKETIMGMHVNNAAGRPRLNKAAADQWLRRFDQYPMPDIGQLYSAPTTPDTPSIPPTRYTGKTLEVGDTCQHVGWYEAPYLNNRVVLFQAGQKLEGEAYTHQGKIIWYELTEEAAREHVAKNNKR